MANENEPLDDDFLADLTGASPEDSADPFSVSESSGFPLEGSLSFPGADPSMDGSTDVFGADSSTLPSLDGADSAAAVAAEPEEPAAGKKGKKAKKEKAPKGAKKEKAAKAPKAPKAAKTKAPKAPKAPKAKRPYVSSPAPVILLLVVLLIALLAVNVLAVMSAGAGCATYLIVLDVLGLVMLLVPFMLLSHLRQRSLGLFDMFMALAAIFTIMSSIAMVTYQAKTYGASSKVSVSAPAVVLAESLETLDC